MSKVTIKNSASVLNTVDVRIDKESHTVAAPIVERLNDNPQCEYASYKIDHPTDAFVTLRIKSGDMKNVKALFKECLNDLIDDVDDLVTQVRQSHD